jgi:peptidoglycan/LPS O-acetylase OafA/YrhL
MILSIILLFSLTALLGLFLVVLGLRYRRKSLTTGLIHAGIGLIAFGFLISQIIDHPINKYNNVTALLMVLVLIGGGMLFALREANKPPPMMLVAIHAMMALAGLLVLTLGFQSS